MTQAQSSQTIRRRRSSAGTAPAAAPESTPVVTTPVESTPVETTPAPAAPAPAPAPAPAAPAPAPAPAAPAPAPQSTGLAVRPEVALAFSRMPKADAPVVSGAGEVPMLSFKMPRPGAPLSWVVSSDGGKTNADAGTTELIGIPVDLRLEISAATWQAGETDYRLRFQFLDQEGFLVEVNLNAINPKRDDPTQRVITGPVRSLLGGLMTASEAEDDMAAVMALSRISLKAGSRRGTFVDLDVVNDSGDGWVQFTGPNSTMKIEQGPYGLVAAVTEIKRRFRAAGFLANTTAVIGQIPMGAGQPSVVPVLVNAEVVES